MCLLRTAKYFHKTRETEIYIKINLDGIGKTNLNTSIPFLDHMINQISCHGLIDLNIKAFGDLNVDYHHLVEDIGITFGKVFKKAIGKKKGISRYGFSYIPLDESLSRVVIDISGRSYLNYNVSFLNSYIGFFCLDLIVEFFIAFVNNAKITLHIDNLKGVNSHHQCESIFKAFGHALKMAISFNKRICGIIPSTKGKL
ncbi:imidazoleglycerol-phosphate dehydratase HisB [Candidatus Zinderia endosymbiont of Aphrophora alni]|uniref:imidazoleglycerol-phosphate dehydratase HisB n=1 Tax=Candidatus Zinderia endosymbiont of Aphrophora alni TaxID=3077951 RepID=UPI0030D3B03A